MSMGILWRIGPALLPALALLAIWPVAGHGAAAIVAPFTLSSPDFKDGGLLPASAEFGGLGCTGANQPPHLTWSGVPAGTRSFALMVLDPDAAAFVPSGAVHWVVYNIPGDRGALGPEAATGYTQGMTVFGRPGYGGPCPPADDQYHHYIFTLYALKVAHLAGPGLTREALFGAMAGKVLGGTSRVGLFKRQ